MRQITLLAGLLLAGSSLFAADPQLLAMAPGDATTFAGINVTQAKTSQFGQFVLNNIPQNADIQKFISETGFDPRTDITEVLLAATLSAPATGASTAQSGHPSFSSGLFLAKGAFNIPKIVATATTDQKVQVSMYSGVQLVTVDGEVAFGLIDGSTLAAGDVASVKAALDRRNGSGSIIDAGILARINQLSTTEDAWSVSTKGFPAGFPMMGASGDSGSAILQSIQQSSAGIKFGSSVVLTCQVIADSAQDAQSLSDVAKMLSQMFAMHSGTGGAPSELTNILKSLTIATDGTSVNLTLTVPEDQLEALVKMAHGGQMPSAVI